MDLLLDTQTWDLSMVDGDLVLTSGIDAIRQHLAQRLKTFLGEWFLDQRRGVPYLQQVLQKNPNPVILDSAFKSIIVDTPGVIELTAFDLLGDPTTRELKVEFTATTTEGVLNFSEVLP